MLERCKCEAKYGVSLSSLVGQGKEEFWEEMKRLGRETIKELITAAVEVELEEFIGAGWHERHAEGRRTTRAGSRERGFTILGHDVRLRIPRARIAGFRSEVIPYRARREAWFDESVVKVYVAGASMRETTALLYEMFGTSVSPGTVQHLVKVLDSERQRFQERELADEYKYLVLDGMHVRCMVGPARKVRGGRGGETVEKICVLLVRGLKSDGTRELVDFRISSGEQELAWESFLRNLYDRGLEGSQTELFVHDGADGIENAIGSVYSDEVRDQRCICHKIANICDAVEDKERRGEVREDASHVYQAETVDEARARLVSFGGKWRREEPGVVRIFQKGFESTLRFFEVPQAERKWITTTNPLERYIRELRRRTRPMGTFQGLASCERLVYVAIKKVSNERRNQIPYSLWTSQPWYGSRRHRRKKPRRGNLEVLRRELQVMLESRITC